jgi:hypothetical protein
MRVGFRFKKRKRTITNQEKVHFGFAREGRQDDVSCRLNGGAAGMFTGRLPIKERIYKSSANNLQATATRDPNQC